MRDDQQPSVTIVPAVPGWHVSTPYHGTDHLTDDPIMAWEIMRYDARPIPGAPGRREPIPRYLTPISTNSDLNANATPEIDGWLLCDPTGRYHEWGGSGPKFNTTEEALAYLMRQRTIILSRRRAR